MKNFFEEAAEFAGHACGIIAHDVSEMSKPLGAAFRQGWKKAWEEVAASDSAEPAPSSENA